MSFAHFKIKPKLQSERSIWIKPGPDFKMKDSSTFVAFAMISTNITEVAYYESEPVKSKINLIINN